MPCADYEHRPQICRDFYCGQPCDGCGKCCHEMSLIGVDITGDADHARFFALHGATQRDGDVLFIRRCDWYVDA